MLSSSTDSFTAAATDGAALSVSSHFFPLTVLAVKQETRDAIAVSFEVPPHFAERFRFTQGQYLTLRALIDGDEVRRSYSICSGAHDGMLRIAIKRTPDGIFSNWAAVNLKPGMRVEVMPPEGRFFTKLAPEHTKNYVAFAVGSGITPVLSIIKTTLFTEPRSTFTLFYGNRASSTIMFREELAELKDLFLSRFTLVHIMTREHQDIDLLNGRITADKADLLVRRFCRFEEIDSFFLCGPQEMVDEVSIRLKEMGLSPAQIKIELFTVASEGRESRRSITPPVPHEECEVAIIADGNRHLFTMEKNAETVLDAALQRGIDLRHSCKSGVCATCRAKLVEGKVDMDANYALEDYEVARGFILTCQSYPVTDRVIIDFDQDN